MFEHIVLSDIDSSVDRIRTVSRGVRSEVKEKLQILTDHFHKNHGWEIVSHRWERILNETQRKNDDGASTHDSIMTLISIMFCIGFDAGYQSKVDEVVEKLLKE